MGSPEQAAWVDPEQDPDTSAASRLAAALPLERRGVFHGWLRAPAGRPARLGGEPTAGERERWDRDRPLVLSGAIAGALVGREAELAATLELFERARDGESEFQDEVWARLGEAGDWVPAGASVDLGDERELEKVFVDVKPGESRVARDLWAKLSWISHDERDASLRIRFSFGAEALFEWREDPARSVWADRLAAAVFPECAVLAVNGALRARIEALVACPFRMSERIVYSNAPGGGAVFHHDAEPGQLGVCYGQFAGETAWLALPKRELAAAVAAAVAEGGAGITGELERTCASSEAVLAGLDDEGAEDLARLLNETPAFTGRLIEAGHAFRLGPGDVLLMPNHGPEETCWHAVFALGDAPSLSHSYGLYDVAGLDPK